MTKSELTEIIRKVVREEVMSQLPGLITEIFTSKQPVAQPTRVVSEQKSIKAAPSHPLINVKNPALRAVLRETSGGVPSESSSPLVSRAIIPAELIAENKDVAAVAAAMTKDYRGLLKAMNKTRGNSNLNFQMSPPTSFEQDPT
jgi:hypothetical protein